ncbi:protein EARLY FLOWERING 3-like isoform X1 [Salvia hispanica]|uniref:protein EARLY FLOWERING 3-like isoform X1 n=2 Tax=Salvia hispanica TaxID=49212 RepID=UPI002009D9A6|nr:protein EARLY FLOWERING 3-like isoform X1 [Salvia hispanica]
MKGDKDEGKQMVPLFTSGLRIGDEDRGGPSAPPPRKTMALFEQGPKLNYGPRLLPVPSGHGSTNFVSQTSSNNVSGVKRKVRPVLASNECPNSPEWYYSHCSAGASVPENYPDPSSSSSLMMKAKCISVQPPPVFPSYSNRCTNEKDFGVSSFLQPEKIRNYGNPQLHVKKEKLDTIISRLSKETKTRDHENSKLYLNSSGNRISHPSIAALQYDHLKKTSMGDDEMSRLDFPQTEKLCLEYKNLPKSKTVAADLSACGVVSRKSTSSIDDKAHSSTVAGDCNLRANIDSDPLSLKIGDGVKREETSDAFAVNSILGLDIASDEVVRVIGQRLFLKARKTMIHQQKVFSLQKFELHRLITVQRHIAQYPEILRETTFDPSIKFPPINKLLYVSPLDPSLATAKAKIDLPKSSLGSEAICGLLPLPPTDLEKGLLPQQTPLPNPASIPLDPKLAPWCLPVPTGNQWLVPVRSPSEGLIYKPYPGPCFPTVRFMAPVYGNCPPVSLGSLGGAAYGGIPPPNEERNEGFCRTEPSQSYLQPYPMPLAGEIDKSLSSNLFVPPPIPCKVSSQSVVVSECGGNLHRSNGSEMQGCTETSDSKRLEGDALPLFPTTPSLQRNEQRVQAIRVVPHNRTLASASAARIFQSIQEERRNHE